ncbi:Aste57867_13930 [Aphanomyces stellatus]|uniref:Aste57867_13930 protein n=1 Tax=Aphanomyces stellatus TaxID=120398 RepID=A0A485KZP9_9STRA|nr:hypothetical protein As57867_013879 [Aphanomyces stellatus]VFT90760.1 Aste57867_13930 [Aphanomyces stellatus]
MMTPASSLLHAMVLGSQSQLEHVRDQLASTLEATESPMQKLFAAQQRHAKAQDELDETLAKYNALQWASCSFGLLCGQMQVVQTLSNVVFSSQRAAGVFRVQVHLAEGVKLPMTLWLQNKRSKAQWECTVRDIKDHAPQTADYVFPSSLVVSTLQAALTAKAARETATEFDVDFYTTDEPKDAKLVLKMCVFAQLLCVFEFPMTATTVTSTAALEGKVEEMEGKIDSLEATLRSLQETVAALNDRPPPPPVPAPHHQLVVRPVWLNGRDPSPSPSPPPRQQYSRRNFKRRLSGNDHFGGGGGSGWIEDEDGLY